jgi:hypothetical protein
MNNDYYPSVLDVTANEFSFVSEMPKREKTRRLGLLDEYHAFCKLMHSDSVPFTLSCAAQFLDVSHQRVCKLCESGRLERVEFLGKPFVTSKSMLAMMAELRKTGVHVRQFLDSSDP